MMVASRVLAMPSRSYQRRTTRRQKRDAEVSRPEPCGRSDRATFRIRSWWQRVERSTIVPPHLQVPLRREGHQVNVPVGIEIGDTDAACRGLCRENLRLAVDGQAESNSSKRT